MPNVGGFGEEWSGTIRAHIAALEAEIANMKNESAVAYKSGRCDAEAEMGHMVQRLEAENKRMRAELTEDE